MQIKYTLKDLKVLTRMISDLYLSKKSFFKEECKVWGIVLKNLKNRFKGDPKGLFNELVGGNYFGYTQEVCQEIGLTDMAFSMPRAKLAFYKNSKKPWQKLIATWRLTIGK